MGQPIGTWLVMMMSSNGNIFRVTGHLCGEFTGPRWNPSTRASDAELWCEQVTSHYLNQWWTSLPTHIWVTLPTFFFRLAVLSGCVPILRFGTQPRKWVREHYSAVLDLHDSCGNLQCIYFSTFRKNTYTICSIFRIITINQTLVNEDVNIFNFMAADDSMTAE